MMIAGEASGDMYGGLLAAALLCRGPVRLVGMGGRKMAEAGVELAYPLADHAIVGWSGVLRSLFLFRRVLMQARRMLEEQRPDALVLLDYPGFNVRLARFAHSRGIPVIYYISPQLWAWNPGRIHEIRRVVDLMLVILPFEPGFYRQAGMEVEFVGHPLLDVIPPGLLGAATPPTRHGEVRLGLLPGSRRGELRHMLPTLLAASRLIVERLPRCRVVAFRAPGLSDADFGRLGDLPVEVCEADYAARARIHYALTASGTATLENALLGVPMCVIYRAGPLNMAIAKALVRIPRIGLVNIVAERDICPEFIQRQAHAQAIADAALPVLSDPARWQEVRRDLDEVRHRLGRPGASHRAADAIVAHLGLPAPSPHLLGSTAP